MGCCHAYFTQTELGDDAFTLDAATATFGAGCLKEAGDDANAPRDVSRDDLRHLFGTALTYW